ncbi:two-component regulator propeller domain-containing protein [Spongiimicrobium sp. 3-5]|uniref:hybrid sensor histidine kinase/response regulator transcription factor n=1 Tax=Spongiimicrobium sp. 3-5 TaxID=3332596 RepID=UPI00397F9970
MMDIWPTCSKIRLLLVIAIGMVCVLNAQNIRLEHYNERNGLSHNSVRHIIQDSKGFLWLGTFSGLNRFDGYEFKNYRSTFAVPNELQNDDITALEYDSGTEKLWIGTRNGLSVFNIKSHRFHTYLPEKANPNSLPESEIRSVHLDTFNRVWVGTKTMGLYLLHIDEDRFEKVPIDDFAYVKEIIQDKKGRIWVGSYGEGGVARITLNPKGAIVHIKNYTLQIPNSEKVNPYVNFIYEDEGEAIFVGTREGLYKLNNDNEDFKNLYIENKLQRESLGPYFLSIAKSPEGSYWLGTLGGILICDKLEDVQTGNYRRYESVLSDDTSLVDNLVSALYFDTSGVLWIGTEDGLDKYDPYENQFILNRDISFHIGNKAPRIRGFSQTQDGKVIAATRHNGLFISEGDSFKPLYKGNYDIASIFTIDGNRFYCGLWNGKIMAYDYAKNSSKLINLGRVRSPVVAFADLGDNLLMAGSFGEGVRVINTNTDSIESRFGTILPGYQINEIVIGKENNIWYATETGVMKFNTESLEIHEYGINPEDSAYGLPHVNVSDIVLGPQGSLWAATRLGLAVYDATEDAFKTVLKPNELQGQWITDLVAGTNGDLWLNMNNNKVAVYNQQNEKANFYDVDSGNRLDVFSSSGFYRTREDKIFLAGKNGIIHFAPYEINENPWTPKPFITEFKVQNKELVPGVVTDGLKMLSEDINFSNTVTLNYNNSNFAIKFSSPSYADEGLNKYQYKLEGFDEDWITTNSNSRTVQYTNLYPDDYTFKLRSSNRDGYWGEETAYFIKVKPPFWLTYQAIFLFLVFASLIIYLIRREVKGRSRLRQELVLERVRRERDEKLNNEKLRFFTNISHELRTPLTLILGPAKQLIEEVEAHGTAFQQKRLGLIHQNANRLLNLVNQILDFRKAQTGQLKLKVSQTDILKYTRTIFNSFQELANNKNIHFYMNAEEEEIIGWIDMDKYDKIIYNLLSNALNFTPRYGSVDLFIGLKDGEENTLIVEVSDDGIGIPMESQKKIFKRFYQASNSKENNTGTGIGLSLVKSLLKLHKGNIALDSAPNKGSIFRVEIPINKNAYQSEEVFEYHKETKKDEVGSVQVLAAKKIIQSTHLKEKVLVVEDNAELRKYLVDYLTDYYKVYEAENGEDGLKICRQIKPVLCVSDVMMPVMDGLQFCKTLKNDESISHIPIILLTALGENEDKISGYKLGADGYLVKPFDPSLLKTRIENIIKSRNDLKVKFSEDVESPVSLLAHSPIDEVFMTKVTALIERELNSVDLTTTYLCREMGMSSSKLYRKIKELTDLAPNEFIRTIRLKKSFKLLKSKKYNVSEVTNLIGFNDPLYFSRCFKKQFGFPPSNLIK